MTEEQLIGIRAVLKIEAEALARYLEIRRESAAAIDTILEEANTYTNRLEQEYPED